jgi:ankyrin repeat protein
MNARRGFYSHPLHLAARRGIVEIVTLLLDAGADVNARADFYGNALQAAAYRGHMAVVRLLLSRDADINAPGPWGSAVMATSRRNNGEVVTLLRKNGAE